MYIIRSTIVTSIVYLSHLSKNKDLGTNAILALTTSKSWKNVESLSCSSLFMIFESTLGDEGLEVLFLLF